MNEIVEYLRTNVTTYHWKGHDWSVGETWGLLHPDKDHWWYDESCVKIEHSTNNMILSTKLNPKTFPPYPATPWACWDNRDTTSLTSPIGAGLITCQTEFGYGKFTIKAKLPHGDNLWPAFWMGTWPSSPLAAQGWPPEIDVFEGYSDNNPNYRKGFWPLRYWNLETNVWKKAVPPLDSDGRQNGVNKGAKHHRGWANGNDPTSTFMEYSIEWRENYIKFYFNGKRVRTIRDKSFLNPLKGAKLKVKLNNGVTKHVSRTNPPNSDFIIKSFTYTP